MYGICTCAGVARLAPVPVDPPGCLVALYIAGGALECGSNKTFHSLH